MTLNVVFALLETAMVFENLDDRLLSFHSQHYFFCIRFSTNSIYSSNWGSPTTSHLTHASVCIERLEALHPVSHY